MATTEAEVVPRITRPDDLSLIHALEVANLRAFPALVETTDEGWVTRLSPGNPAKRINTLNFLMSAGCSDVEAQLATVWTRFGEAGVSPQLRWTPLTPEPVDAALDAAGWDRFGETRVLTRPLSPEVLGTSTADLLIQRLELDPWVEAFGAVGGTRPQTVEAEALRTLREALMRAKTELVPLAVADGDGAPIAVLLGVIDGNYLGIFDVATAPAHRRKGLGMALMRAGLGVGAQSGARTAWLQVSGENQIAQSLYAGLGFSEAYRYHYRRPREITFGK